MNSTVLKDTIENVNYVKREFHSTYGVGRSWVTEKKGRFKMVLSNENILESYEQGDVVLIEELLKVFPENEDLKNIEERCWTHEYFKENGESYEEFKEDYAKVVSTVIGQDFVSLLEEYGH